MDDKQLINAQTHREDSFDIAVRGFNRQQVLEYMSRSSQLLASLEQNLAVARADVQRARAEAERAEAESERLRSLQAEAKPVHEEVSARLSQILRLASEEADQDRATANREIAELHQESQAQAEQMVAQARAEAEHHLAQARDTAERELVYARETAERELAQARATAEEDLRSAQEEADRIRLSSEEQSAELLDDAARRAGAVNEVSDQRLDTLTATHGEAVLRLGQIRDVLADLLDRDAAAGSLAQVVEAITGPARGSRPELDSRPELVDGSDQSDAGPVDEADSGYAAGDQDDADPVDDARPVDADPRDADPRDADPRDAAEDDVAQKRAELDQTVIVPPVAQTAVHPAFTGERLEGEAADVGPHGTMEIERVEDTNPEIDLRDHAVSGGVKPGISTRR